ncbi:MAG: ABC transporter transmembrane domain-containing protein [Desulfomicrobium escambiense]|nr:ABC transporter transmembrane domain-containing protein [Desulfomicrobium escambiense]
MHSFTWMSNRAANDLRSTLHRKIQLLSAAFADRRKTGDIMSSFTSDIPVMQGLYSSLFVNLLTEAVRFVVVLGGNAWHKRQAYSLSHCPAVPRIRGASGPGRGGSYKRASKRGAGKKRADFNALLQEQIAGLRTSAAYGLEKVLRGRGFRGID